MSAQGEEDDLLTVDELATATGTTVRNARYYASLGLLPAPERRGRIAYYTSVHRARLELVRALQDHGFTLSAIATYLERVPDDATAEDLALQRVMLTSWHPEPPAALSAELLDLGLPADSLEAADEAIARHMDALADELTDILRSKVLAPYRRGSRTEADKARLEHQLARLRELTMEAVVNGFRRAADQVIERSLRR